MPTLGTDASLSFLYVRSFKQKSFQKGYTVQFIAQSIMKFIIYAVFFYTLKAGKDASLKRCRNKDCQTGFYLA